MSFFIRRLSQTNLSTSLSLSFPFSLLILTLILLLIHTSPLPSLVLPVYGYIPAIAVNDTSRLNLTDSSGLNLRYFAPAGVYDASISYQLEADVKTGGIDSGALIHFTENGAGNNLTTTTPWIAMISCDVNETNASDTWDIFTLARDRGAVAALLYTTTAESCLINQEYIDNFEKPVDVFSTKSRSSAILIENQFSNTIQDFFAYNFTLLNMTSSKEEVNAILNTTTATLPTKTWLIATLTARNSTGQAQTSYPTATNAAKPSEGGPTNRSLAMIVLYCITGIITACFAIVVAVGAVRAIRHPERYGPQAEIEVGETPQTRAQGIGQAILDTFPVVKFSRKRPVQNRRKEAIAYPTYENAEPETAVNRDVGEQEEDDQVVKPIMGHGDDDDDDEERATYIPMAAYHRSSSSRAQQGSRAHAGQKGRLLSGTEETFGHGHQSQPQPQTQSQTNTQTNRSARNSSLFDSSDRDSFHSAASTSYLHHQLPPPQQQLQQQSQRDSQTQQGPTQAVVPIHPYPNNPSSFDAEEGGRDAPEIEAAARALAEHEAITLHRRRSLQVQNQQQQQQLQQQMQPHRRPNAAGPFTHEEAQEEEDEEEDESCPICLLEFEDGDDVRVLPCQLSHAYHKSCIDPWLLEVSSSCPLCRKDFSAAPEAPGGLLLSASDSSRTQEQEQEYERSRGSSRVSSVAGHPRQHGLHLNPFNHHSHADTGPTSTSTAGASKNPNASHEPDPVVPSSSAGSGGFTQRFGRYLTFVRREKRRRSDQRIGISNENSDVNGVDGRRGDGGGDGNGDGDGDGDDGGGGGGGEDEGDLAGARGPARRERGGGGGAGGGQGRPGPL